MRVFCVTSHHDISFDPLKDQGVLLNNHMLLERGVWKYDSGGDSHIMPEKERRECTLVPSGNNQEYQVALSVLMGLDPHDVKSYMAVVSMRWCSWFRRLVPAKRVWLRIYHQNERGTVCAASYTHWKDENNQTHPYGTFLGRFSAGPQIDPNAWRQVFETDLNIHWKAELKLARRRKSGRMDVEYAERTLQSLSSAPTQIAA